MSRLDVGGSINLMKDKKRLLDEMYLLSDKQRVFIEDEEFEKLEEVLNDKDEIIEEINKIDLKLKEVNSNDQIDNKDISDLNSDIKKVLMDIKALDDSNNKVLSESMVEMKTGIKNMRQGMRGVQNYGNNDPYESFTALGGTLFIDQDS